MGRLMLLTSSIIALMSMNSVIAVDSDTGKVIKGSMEGWSLALINGLVPKFAKIDSVDGTGISASDDAASASSWYFVSPGESLGFSASGNHLSGNIMWAYNGKLSFSVVSMAVMDARAKKDLKDPLVVLQATCGHYLYWTSTASKITMTVMLNEDAGWIDSRTGKEPGLHDMLGVLSHLQHIKIKGGFFKTSAEATRLGSVEIVPSGKIWYPCCTLTNDIDICAKKPTDWFSPSNLAFYCEGSQRKTIKVTNIYPRFSRRTGGALITVVGQNFGLSGSEPIVRVGGRKCENTRYASGSQTNTVREALNNKNGNALINAWNTATDSMKSMYPEHCWNGMKDDGHQNSPLKYPKRLCYMYTQPAG
jgi:hypothetical protein